MSESQINDCGAPSASLWLVDGRNVDERDAACFGQRLDGDEARRYARFVRPERRRQFLLGRMLMRFVVGRLTQLPPAAIKIIERPADGPRLVLPDGVAPPGFSLSHSRHWIACAASRDTTLGLDIEVMDPVRDVIGLGRSCFDAHEAGWLAAHAGEERAAAFYRLWGMKEALFKLKSNLGIERHVPVLVNAKGELASQGDGWVSSIIAHPDLSIAICSPQSLQSVSVIEYTTEENFRHGRKTGT